VQVVSEGTEISSAEEVEIYVSSHYRTTSAINADRNPKSDLIHRHKVYVKVRNVSKTITEAGFKVVLEADDYNDALRIHRKEETTPRLNKNQEHEVKLVYGVRRKLKKMKIPLTIKVYYQNEVVEEQIFEIVPR